MAIEMMMRALRVKPDFKPAEVYDSTAAGMALLIHPLSFSFFSSFYIFI